MEINCVHYLSFLECYISVSKTSNIWMNIEYFRKTWLKRNDLHIENYLTEYTQNLIGLKFKNHHSIKSKLEIVKEKFSILGKN